jgi:hypothetical protein
VKLKAFILLAAGLIYIAEWITVPGNMNPSTAACCGKAVKGKIHNECAGKEKQGKTAAYNCSDCPMCYITIIPGSSRVSHPLAMTGKNYSGFQSGRLYGYTADTWKPPDAL